MPRIRRIHDRLEAYPTVHDRLEVYPTVHDRLEAYPTAIQRLRYDTSGATSVEYAWMLAAGLLLLISAIVLFGDRVRSIFANTQHELSATVEVGDDRPHVSANPFSDPGATVTRDRRGGGWGSLILACLLLLAVAALITLLVVRWRQRDRSAEPAEEVVTVEAADEELEQHLYRRRQILLRRLLNDTDLLLRNRLQVRHIMSDRTISVPSHASIDQIVTTMQTEKIPYVFVLDKDEQFLGVIGQRDVVGKTSPRAAALVRRVQTVSREMPIAQAAAQLIQCNQSCLPVVDDQRLVGALTSDDLVMTLQCSLQMFLKLVQYAQIANDDIVDPRQFETDLQRQRSQLAELRRVRASDPAPADWDRQTELLLQQHERIAEQMESAQRQLQERFDRAMALLEPRIDTVTGVGNRRALDQTLQDSLRWKLRYQHPVAIVVVASANDQIAEEHLREAAQAMDEVLRETDVITRYNDHAFVIICPNTDDGGAERLVERLTAVLTGPEHWHLFMWSADADIGLARQQIRDTILSVRQDCKASESQVSLEFA